MTMNNEELIPGMEKIIQHIKRLQEENKKLKQENVRLRSQAQHSAVENRQKLQGALDQARAIVTFD